MKRIILLLTLLGIAAPAMAKTAAWWEFEDGTDETTFYEMEQSGSASRVGGHVILCEGDEGPDYSSETHSGVGLSCHVSTGEEEAGYVDSEELNMWSPLTWTIEISFRMTSSYSSSYKTMIGRDGSSYDDTDEATFYFQRRGSGSGNYALRLNYATVEGGHIECLSSFIPSQDQWYHAALVCDGEQVMMYIDSMDGNGYQMVQSTELDTTKDNRMLIPNGGEGGNWAFGRGWYGGEKTDYCSAYLDDIRFSDEALTPEQFLHSYGIAWGETPVDGARNYGIVSGDEYVAADLSWNTALNSMEPGDIDTQVVMHHLYMSGDQNVSDDPNLYFVTDVPVAGAGGEISFSDLNYDGLYLWRIDEGINDGSGGTLPVDDPNYQMGKVWQFGTLLSVPVVTLEPENCTVEAGQTAVFNTEARSISPAHYQWYSSDDDIVSEDDVAIGTASLTGELEIANVAVSDEKYYYCLIYNDGGVDNGCYSTAARLVVPRQLAILPMNIIESSITPDTLEGHDLTLVNDLLATSLPTVVEGANEQSGNGILFDNSNIDDPNHYGQYGRFEPGVVSYDDITIAMWVNWQGGEGTQHIFDFASSSREYMYITPSFNDELHFSLKNDGSSQYLDAPELEVGVWKYITITIDSANTTGCLYIDGELADTNDELTYRLSDFMPSDNYLAFSSWADDPPFNGMIDNVQIFNYALSELDVARMYIADAPGMTACIQSARPEGQFDYNGDCIVNVLDFAVLAASWLDCAIMPDCIQ